MAQVFDGLRVVDLTHGFPGALVTMVLADNGADVTRIVAPAGSAYAGDPAAAAGGYVQWHRGKRTVALDLHDAGDLDEVRRLLRGADVLVESFRPGVTDRLGLGHDELARDNPGLVHCSITGFGQTGEWRDVPGYEGVVMALAGRMADDGRMFGLNRPAFVAVPQASFGASQAALQGICAALHVRRSTGRGQRVDTSLLHGMTAYDMAAFLGVQGPPAPAPAPSTSTVGPMPGTAGYVPARTRDGKWIQWANATSGPHLFWAMAELVGLGHLRDDPDFAGLPAKGTPEVRYAFWEHLLEATAQRTADEWMAAVLESGQVGGDIMRTTNEGMDHPQIRHNGDVVAVSHPELGPTEQLGPIARFSATPSRITAEPAEPGEPTPPGDAAGSWPAPASTEAPAPAAPLEGVTVLEVATMYAAPFGPALLADLGARVVKVEALTGDPLRTIGQVGVKPGQGKESIAIDLKQPEGQEIVQRLAERADLFLHNFRPGVPERLGIDDATLRARNPDLVYLYAGSYGDSGPCAHLPAYHPIPGAICGTALAQAGEGWPPPPDAVLDAEERKAVSLRLARANDGNPDVNGALVVATVMLMGLVARERHGIGQSMVSTMLAASAYAMSDDWIRYDGKPDRPLVDGDLLGLGALYRLYETAEGWVFLACTNEREWGRLVAAVPDAGLDGDDRFATAAARRDHDEALATALETAFRKRPADEWQRSLLGAGVACVRADGDGFAEFLATDPSARANGVVGDVTAPDLGTYWRHGAMVRLSASPPRLGRAPAVGEHTRPILRELGYDDAAIDDLAARRVVRLGS